MSRRPRASPSSRWRPTHLPSHSPDRPRPHASPYHPITLALALTLNPNRPPRPNFESRWRLPSAHSGLTLTLTLPSGQVETAFSSHRPALYRKMRLSAKAPTARPDSVRVLTSDSMRLGGGDAAGGVNETELSDQS